MRDIVNTIAQDIASCDRNVMYYDRARTGGNYPDATPRRYFVPLLTPLSPSASRGCRVVATAPHPTIGRCATVGRNEVWAWLEAGWQAPLLRGRTTPMNSETWVFSYPSSRFHVGNHVEDRHQSFSPFSLLSANPSLFSSASSWRLEHLLLMILVSPILATGPFVNSDFLARKFCWAVPRTTPFWNNIARRIASLIGYNVWMCLHSEVWRCASNAYINNFLV